jgi:hypothetical protein
VQERCLERLLDYVDGVDLHVQKALEQAAGRAEQPTDFDYAGRLERATRLLERAVGTLEAAIVGAWDEFASLCAGAGGRRALFYDPKPANFLMHEGIGRPGPDDPLYKIDIDWMLTRAPIAHQALVAVLSHPIRSRSARVPGAVLNEVRALVRSKLMKAEADPEQLDGLVVYHLYRNYASKLKSAPDQARAIKPFLIAAIERLRAVDVPPGTIELVEACDRLPAVA